MTGEEWLVRQVGAYLPGVFEEVSSILRTHIRASSNTTKSDWLVMNVATMT